MEFAEGMSKVAQAFELVGVGILIVGAVLVAWTTVVALIRKQPAYEQSRIRLGRTLLLSLEVLVAADLIRTITSQPSIEDALILGLIVVIRTILSMSIQIEIEGTLPWRRALVTSGASVVAGQVKKDAQSAQRP